MEQRGGEGLKEKSRWWWVNGRRTVDRHKREEKSEGDGERSGRKIESARKTKR